MAKASPGINSFNAGELSPLVDARTDRDWYRSGCKRLENFIPLIQGPAMKLPGTKFIASTKSPSGLDSSNRCWLGRFIFSAYEAFVLEFGEKYIRFYADRGQLNFSTPAAWSSATQYYVGDLVANGGVNYYCIRASINNAPPNTTYWHALTGTIYEIPTPWPANTLFGQSGEFVLSIAQVGDILYITDKEGFFEPVKITRYSDTRWVLEKLVTGGFLKGGPFEKINSNEAVTVYANATAGIGVTLTASSAIFLPGHVGGLFYLGSSLLDGVKQWESGKVIAVNDIRRSNDKNYKALNAGTTGTIRPTHSNGSVFDGDAGVQWQFLDPGYGWGKITLTGSSTFAATTATVDVISRIPEGAVGSANASHRWAFGRFSGELGWPTHVTFFRERLTFIKDQTILCSVAGDFENFSARNESGLVTVEQAYTGTISTDQTDKIQWISPAAEGLIIGTMSSELVCSEMTITSPFGPGNVKVEPKTNTGSRGVSPIKIDDAVMFIQRSGRSLHQFSISQDGYRTVDLSARNDQITLGGIVDMAFQQEPWKVLWCVRADGTLLGFTYNREQEVVAWHRHILGGSFSGGSAVVEAVQCIPSPTNDRDDLYLIVKRTINGVTKRYVEFLHPEYVTGDAITSAFYVHCGLSYNGAPTSTITGLGHLEGQEVDVLADGAAHPRRTVSGGSITLQSAYSVVHVGLPYTATLQTMRLEAGSQDGTAQGKTKRITNCVVRLFNSVSGKIGSTEANATAMKHRGNTPMDQAPPAYSGDTEPILWPGGYDTEGYVFITHDKPTPITVVGIFPQVVTQDR